MLQIILPILSIIGNILLSLFVFLNNRKSATNVLFAIIAFSFSGVALGTILATSTRDPNQAIFWVRVNMFFAAIVVSSLFPFLHTYPGDRVSLNKKVYIPIIVWGFTLAILCFTPLIFKEARFDPNLNTIPGPGIAFFGVTLIVNLILGGFSIVKKYLKSKGLVRAQIQFLALGLLSTFLLLTILNFITVVIFKNTSFVNFGVSSIIIFIASTTYAIVRHRLLDVRLLVARAIAYASLVLLVASFFIGSTVGITSLFLDTTTSLQQIALYAVLTLIVALGFQRLRRTLEVATDKIFFKADYDSNQLLSELTKIMAETILIDDIANKLLNKIIFEMRITRGAFVLTDGGQILVTETQGYKLNEEPTFSEKDIFSLQAIDKNLIFEDLEEGPAKELLRKLNISVVVPLRTGVDHVGLLLLGEKASGEIYSAKDIRVLEIFAPEAAISFENAASVEKIRRFNITLREQVDRATKELKSANEQLKSLDKLKDEFLSIASHDLRTPMTAIKSYLWMAVNGRAGELNPQLKHYLDVSYSSSERMITMINDLLNVSRIEAGRVQMTFEDAELKPIVDQVFAEMAAKAGEKSIELKYDQEEKLPHVILDKQRFPEVLQNLVGNALKFTPEKGKVTITAKKSKDVGFVEIAVTDTGVGISEEDKKNLFSKYGRMEHSYAAASTSGGTGLGLYISKNYIDLHGGSIWVESTLGKGTSFIFNIKIVEKEALEKMNQTAQQKQIAPAIPKMG